MTAIATGEWILFTDADVQLHPNVLHKALHYIANNNLDHLTLIEDNIRPGIWIKLALLGMYVAFALGVKPWKAKDAYSNVSVGLGPVFLNLVYTD